MKNLSHLLILLTILCGTLFGQGISVDHSYSGKFKPMREKEKSESPLTNSSTQMTKELKQSALKDTLIIDFESRELTYAVYDTLTGKVIWHHHYGELEQYLRELEESVRSGLWNRKATESGKLKEKIKKDEGLKFVVPTHLPPWLQRIVGDQPPQLSISGTQTITLGGSRTKRGTYDSTGNLDDTTIVTTRDFLFAPSSDFSIKGEIGRLLELEIRLKGNIAESEFWEDAKDDLSEIKVHYKESKPGELEDDIIQEVVIGKTDFKMPGTGLAGYATGSNEGLFGIKVRSKIGPLDLTTIASIEQMEVEHKTINISGGLNSNSRRESEFIKNQFFFLSDDYRRAYGIDSIPVPIVSAENLIILQEMINYTSDDVIDYGDIQVDSNSATIRSAFKKMVEGEDYRIDHQRGIINFIRSVPTNTRVGIIFSAGTIQRGDGRLNPAVNDKGDSILVYQDVAIIKESNQKSTDSTYNLMLRNAYSIGATTNIAAFELSLSRYFSETQSYTQNQGESRLFTEILGISDSLGQLSKGNDQIFDFENGYLFLPPFDTTGDSTGLDPLLPFTNPLLGTNLGVSNVNFDIYSDKTTNIEDKYMFEITSSSRAEGFSIDWGIEQGTVRIYSGGKDYIEGTDYRIEYGSGYVTLISNEIKTKDKLEVDYQRSSLFLLEKRVFLGVNGMLQLPGIGNNSFFSTTFMWQIMDSKKNEIPKVGTEPYNRYLFDSNLKLAFEPYWMTSVVNKLPGVETEQVSQAEFDIEIAHSTVKSSNKDGGGSAIDDFSNSSLISPLGTDHEGWYKAAPDSLRADSIGALENPLAWHSYWILPKNDDQKPYESEIYLYSTKTKTARLSPLRIVVKPLPLDPTLVDGVVETGTDSLLVNPWAGVTKPLYGNGDQRENRYLEFWIRVPSGKGNLLIDLGVVAEDIQLEGALNNNKRDVESNLTKVPAENDIGIDQTVNSEEKWYYPDFGGTSSGGAVWKELQYEDSALGNFGDNTVPDFRKDPAHDNFRLYDRDSLYNRIYANGTEGNRAKKSSPDGEDLNGDGGVLRPGASENYFRYNLNLDTLTKSPFYDSSQIAENAKPGYSTTNATEDLTPWHHIRIPMSIVDDSLFGTYIDSINNPSWNDVQFVRLIWTDFATTRQDNTEKKMELVDIQIVGSQWQEAEVDTTSGDSTKLIVTTTDYESTPSYEWPPSKEPITINAGRDTVNDYTLNIDFSNVPSGDTAYFVEKKLGSAALNLSNYKDMKMWVKVEDDGSNADVWFVYRFGKGLENFYEFKTQNPWTNFDPSTAWDSDSGHTIVFDSLTALKLDWFNVNGEFSNTILDTTIAYNGSDSIRVYSANRDYPSLSNVTWLAFGIINVAGADWSGLIKVNGLRSSGIREYRGWGFRSDVKLSWADFMNNSARVNYRDAHFRSMTDDVTRPGNSNINAGMASKIQLDKFMAPEFGVQLPIGGEIASSIDRPEIIPNSDIMLPAKDGKPDGVKEMAGDFVRQFFGRNESGDTTQAEKYQSSSRTRTLYTGFHKNRTSKTAPARILIDRVDIDYRLNYTESEDRKGRMPIADIPNVSEYGSDSFHVEIDTSRKHTVTLDYDFSPSKKVLAATSWEPFKKSKNRILRNISLNLLPERVTFDVLNLNYHYNHKYNSTLDAQDTSGNYLSISRPQEKINASHAMDITFKPIDPLFTITYAQQWQRNFDDYLSNDYDQSETFSKQALFEYDPTFKTFHVLHSEKSRNQTAKMTFSPNLTRWLTVRTSLSSNYTQNYRLEDSTSYLDGNVTSTFDFSTTLQFRRLFDEWSKKAARISDGLTAISKGLRAIDFENISFDYKATMGQRSSFLDSAYMHSELQDNMARYLAYTFGVHNRSFEDVFKGGINDQDVFGGVQNRDTSTVGGKKSLSDMRTTSQSIGARTKFSLPEPVNITFNTLSLSWNRTYNINWESTRVDTSKTWPDIRIGATTPLLEDIGIVKTHFKSMKLTTGYNYRMTTTTRGKVGSTKLDTNGLSQFYDSLNIQKVYSHGFMPLVKLDFRLKKYDLSFNYYTNVIFDSTDQSDEITDNPNSGALELKQSNFILGKETRTVENSWEGNYHRAGRKGRTLRLFKNQVVKVIGDTDYGLVVNYTAWKHTVARGANSGTSENEDYNEFALSISPRVTYQFTKNLIFEVYYKLNNSLKNTSRDYIHTGEMAGIVTFNF